MKGQLVNPELEKSEGRLCRRVDLVPLGDIRYILIQITELTDTAYTVFNVICLIIINSPVLKHEKEHNS